MNINRIISQVAIESCLVYTQKRGCNKAWDAGYDSHGTNKPIEPEFSDTSSQEYRDYKAGSEAAYSDKLRGRPKFMPGTPRPDGKGGLIIPPTTQMKKKVKEVGATTVKKEKKPLRPEVLARIAESKRMNAKLDGAGILVAEADGAKAFHEWGKVPDRRGRFDFIVQYACDARDDKRGPINESYNYGWHWMTGYESAVEEWNEKNPTLRWWYKGDSFDK